GDDFDLVRVDVEAEFAERDLLAGIVDALEGCEIPVGPLEQQPLYWPHRHGHGVTFDCASRFWKR
ncbi:hypothetical protein ACC810_38875, partial [Rhizobium ruizarguesonis]